MMISNDLMMLVAVLALFSSVLVFIVGEIQWWSIANYLFIVSLVKFL